jgi:hypothetical protein
MRKESWENEMGKKVEKKKLDEIRVRKLGKMGKKLGIK